MHNPRMILYSTAAIVVLVLLWGIRQIPAQGHLANQVLRESLNQELIVLGSAVKASTQAMKYRLLDVLKAEGNDHATRAFQDSPFIAATLLEWDDVQWKSLWYSNKSSSDFQSGMLTTWLKEWPLSKLAADEVFFAKAGEANGQPYFAILVPVRRPNQKPMVGVGIFPAAQFGLGFSADENREVRVFTTSGAALALTHPAYLGATVRNETLVREILDGDEVSVRHEWKSDHGTKMIGFASRVSDSNLYAAIEAKDATGSSLAAWAYLCLCALGAGILNWVFFNSVLRTLLSQISQVENSNQALRKQLTQEPRPTVVQQPAYELLPEAPLQEMDFTEENVEPEVVNAISEALTPVEAEAKPEIKDRSTLATVAQASLQALQTRIRENNISVLHFGLEDLPLQNDSLQMQTALEEVLKNAIESMTGSSTRNLTVSAQAQDSQVRLSIEDTGCGIPEGDVARVFDPFFSTKDGEGVARGLGLSVVRRVIEELQGQVIITSRHGGAATGTRVEIILPAEPPAADLVCDWDWQEPMQIKEGPTKRVISNINIRKPVVRSLD